jgi:hypothetical protein
MDLKSIHEYNNIFWFSCLYIEECKAWRAISIMKRWIKGAMIGGVLGGVLGGLYILY